MNDSRSPIVEVDSDRGLAMVVREEPLLIEIAGESVLTMRTPGHDRDLGLGFLLSEGILASLDSVEGVEEVPRSASVSTYPVDLVRVKVLPGAELGAVAREKLSRAHAIRASCGLCGLTSAEGLTRHLQPLAPGGPRVDLAHLSNLMDTMRAGQQVFQATGGCHAAGVFEASSGEAWAIREDVGRHNALDKSLGACAQDGRDLSQSVVLLSGRGGYELVLKALRMGVPVVASVSAPSSLAIEVAEEHGQTLIGFLRAGEGRVYCDDGRVSD